MTLPMHSNNPNDPIRKLTEMIDEVNFMKYNEEVQTGPIEKYIDHPFFKNNTRVIQRLNELYKSTENENVLFLMYNRSIAQFHYSYYANFADYFIKVCNYAAADYILRKGIRMECYRKQVLVDMLEKLPLQQIVADENVRKVFKRKSIVLFNKEWVNQERSYVSNLVVHCNGQCFGLMERKAYDYLKKTGAKDFAGI
ncbi:putative Mad3/BUB1 like region 1 protein [Trachipleistophora hominis]|uniref:Putative Mad3/BUB1 like region 1 protein n=1 Tax=Trachipleistophora hominis TaxID=72359 RepID=L7JQU9_TRAHO|nr:putative Mad3/BUB1 like region 1 protein [Trachipleistophora hominis]